jgi:hypothetical protein
LSHIGLESIYNYNPMGFVVRSLHRLMWLLIADCWLWTAAAAMIYKKYE